MTRAMRVAICMALATSLAACQRSPGGLHVTAHSPDGEIGESPKSITVTFDRKVVAPSAIMKDQRSGPISFQPAVAGVFRWMSAEQLSFLPDAPLAKSTEYRVTVSTELRSVDGKGLDEPFVWKIVHDRLKVKRSLSEGFVASSKAPELSIELSQPVRRADAAAQCYLEDGAGKQLPVTVKDPQQPPTKSLVFSTSAALQSDAAYVLVCRKELRPAEGTLGLAEELRAKWRTYGVFAVASIKPSGNNIDPDEAKLEITFSNPVDQAALTAQLTAKPEVPGLTSGYFTDSARRIYRATMRLQPQTEYTITIKDALVDLSGQKLKEPVEVRFRTGDARPKVGFKTGTHLLETSLPRYPVWSRNVTKLEVETARIAEDKIVPLLRGLDYSSWRERDTEAKNRKGVSLGLGPAFVKSGGLKPRKQTVPITHPKNKWQQGGLDLANLAGGGPTTGLFAVAVYSPEEATVGRAVAAITNLGIIAKIGVGTGLVWVVHLDSGQPAAGVRVTVRNGKNSLRYTGTTDADGLVELPSAAQLTGASATPRAPNPEEEYGSEREDGPEQLFVIAREGEDLSLVQGDWRDGLWAWNFNLPESSAPEGAGTGKVRGFLQTDRGIYRPGETVHLKGLVRSIDPKEGLRPPKDKRVEIVVQNARGDEMLKTSPQLTSFGGFSFDVPLDTEAPLGDWSVIARIGKGAEQTTFRDHFSVQEYRPTAFEVRLRPERQSYLLGQEVKVGVEGNYLYGAPLAGAKASITVQRRDHIATFKGYEEYGFTDYNALDDLGMYWARDGERSYTNEVMSEELTLDKSGKAMVKFLAKDPKEEIKTAQDLLVEATVTDATNQTRSAQSMIVAHKSSLYLGLKSEEWVPQVGKPFGVKLVALDEEGRARKADATLVMALRTYKCGYTQARGYSSYHCDTQERELERKKVAIGEQPTRVELTATEGGTLLVSVIGSDGKGHDVTSSQTVWATGAGEASWRDSEDNHFPLIASKKRYRAGETARLVAQSPLKSAVALVTLERDGVFQHKVQPFQSAQAIDVPLVDRYAPNIYASVVLVSGRTARNGLPKMKMGMVNLEVDATQKRLNVKVTTDRPTYRPGEKVSAKIEVKDLDGKPVVGEVALSAADEGVLQLIGFQTPDPMARFYAAYALGVQTSSNFSKLIVGEESEDNDEDGEGGDGGDQAGQVRKKFLSTAYWAPALVTSPEGVAEVSFTAPDNLTAFRLMASVADATDRFGSADMRISTAKPLQAQPALPRFFTLGDKAQIGVVLHNDTKEAGKVKLTAKVDGATLHGSPEREVSVPPGETRAVSYDVEAGALGTAKFLFAATMGSEKDAIEIKLPVIRPEAHETVLLHEGEAKGTTPIPTSATEMPPDGKGEIEVVLDGSGLASLDESMRYLIGYPYGCLEQTTSRVVPMVMVEDLAKTLDLAAITGSNKNLKRFVEAGLAKIVRHQHSDGAFSLWPSSNTEPFLTAFGLFGLEQARKKGYKIQKRVFEDGISALRSDLESGRDMGHSDNLLGESASRAFALYVLAELGQPDLGAAQKLFENRAALPAYGKAFLAKAMAKTKASQTNIDALVNEVLGFAKPGPKGQGLIVLDPQQEKLWWHMSSDVRTTAIALYALLDAAPQHKSIDPLVEGLLASRTAGRWDSTEDNFWTLVALSAYAQKRAGASALSATLALGDKVLWQGALGAGGPKGEPAVRRVKLALADVKGQALLLTPQGGGVRFSAKLRFARSLEKAEAKEAGMRVERKLFDPDKDVEKTTIKAGDLVRVVLTVYATEQRNRVALVDYLPAAFEPVNPRLKRPEPDAYGDSEGEGSPDYEWVGLEQRDTRVAVFADYLYPSGQNRFEYLVRATTAGTFLFPSATVEEMYRPSQYGRSAAGSLTVVAR